MGINLDTETYCYCASVKDRISLKRDAVALDGLNRKLKAPYMRNCSLDFVLEKVRGEGFFKSPSEYDDWIFGKESAVIDYCNAHSRHYAEDTGLICGAIPVSRWKGLSFRHKTEQLLAEEFHRREIPFCASVPILIPYRDCAFEIDFLVFLKGKIGALELDGSSHNSKWASDMERRRLIQKNTAIKIFEHFSSDLHPVTIVDEFIALF